MPQLGQHLPWFSRAHERLADEDGIDTVAAEVGQVVRRLQTAFRDAHDVMPRTDEFGNPRASK